ncbi:hypothetical protein KH5_14620 [Urechidicola sp. KH5]
MNKVLSYLLHPIIMPVVGTIIYFILLPQHINRQTELYIILAVFIGTYAVPLLFLYSLKYTKAIRNFHLEDPHERKFPVLFFMSISFLLANLIFKGVNTFELALFFMGVTVALAITYALLYVKFKASLHMIGITGMIGFFLFFSFEFQLNILPLLAFLFVIAGFIANARIKLEAHTTKEVFFGAAIGIISQITVYIFYNI